MKLKKILFCFLLTALLVSLVTAAPAFPHPVYGKIMAGDNAIMNIDLEVKNLNNGVISETKTNNEGFFQVELANVDPTYRDGDSIKVSLIYCKSLPRCSKTVQISGGGNEVSFNIFTEDIPEPVSEDVIVVKYVCWDGTAVGDKSSCPVEPVIVKIECADGSIVDNEEDCPESKVGWIAGIIGILAVVFGGLFSGGWKFYNGKFKHYHRGIKSYHDPSTRHSNPKYRHRLWKDGALGCIRDVKDIQKGIDLSEGGGN